MSSSSKLIAQVTLRTLIKRLESALEDDPFPGCFWILSGFTSDQIANFITFACDDPRLAGKLHIELPRSIYGGIVDDQFLVDHSAVQTRALDRTGRVILTVDSEADVGTSLNHKETISADGLKSSDESAEDWLEIACRDNNCTFSPNDTKAFVAMIKGVFDAGLFSLTAVASYIRCVIAEVHHGTTIAKAAGIHLPELGVPKWEDCFLPLYPNKLNHRSQWNARLESHQKNSGYLTRRTPDGPLLDPGVLKDSLKKLLEKEAIGEVVVEGLVQSFSDYVQAESTNQQAAKRLLFDYDWKDVKGLFEKAPTKSTVRKFVEETRQALQFAGIEPTRDENTLLDELASKKSRKSGEATEEEVSFFETFEDVISQHNPKLASEWQDFVFEKKAVCTDFIVGLFDCIRRRIPGLTPGYHYRVVVEGVRQDTINGFKSFDPVICRYFQRHYGGLSGLTGGLISFSGKGTGRKETLLPNFEEDVQKKLEASSAKKNTKQEKKLEFRITFEEQPPGETDWKKSPMSSIPLTWNFPPDSVPAAEEADLAAILKHANKGKSSLAKATANYASVGKNGILNVIDLTNTDGLAPSDGERVCGRFIPSITKIRSIDIAMLEVINGGKVEESLASAIREALNLLEASVKSAIEAYANNALNLDAVPKLAKAYCQIHELIGEIKHDHTRKQLTQLITQFGSVTIREANRRPTVTIICPWHPLRLQAHRARVLQLTDFIREALNPKLDQYSDGRKGGLFIKDVQELGAAPLLPDLAVSWEGLQANLMSLTSHFGNYSIHQTEDGRSRHSTGGTENVNEAAGLIMAEITDYLTLQPHERDNLAILLYNCDSSDLPARLVDELNKRNRDPKGEKVNCEILLTNRDETRLQDVYQSLVADSSKIKGDERDNDFLSRVRINLSAAQAIPASRRTKRSKPTDIAFCRDELSKEARLHWVSCSRTGHTLPDEDLIAHRWQRMLPFEEGSGVVQVYLTCPAQSQAGWSYLSNIGFVCDSQTAKHAAEANKQILPVRSLNFDNKEVKTTIDEIHKLGVWVLNQDQLLDRRLLEDRSVRVIRYVQSTSTGHNTVISSTARDTLLINSIQEILRGMLPNGITDDDLKKHARRFMAEANAVSGKLVLRAARRSNNTKELLGVVLSKYLIESQIDTNKSTCWFLLDDYAHWLGKQDGKRLADLLVLSPSERDGRPHLEIAVSEAKFGTPEDVSGKKTSSEKQLQDTLTQIARALASDPAPADQELWLARLADMLLSRLISSSSNETAEWRSLIRAGKCTFSLVGYSHVFCHLPCDSVISSHKGVPSGVPEVLGHQEIFNFDSTREIILQMLSGSSDKSLILRQQAGHPDFVPPKAIDLTKEKSLGDSDSVSSINEKADKTEPGINPSPEVVTPVPTTAPEQVPLPQPEAILPVSKPEILHDGSILGFLSARAAIHAAKVNNDEVWLKSTASALQFALHRYGMSAKIAEGRPPILTPNAALIRLQGGPDLTINHLEKRIEELYTTDGLKILSLLPGQKMISVSVERPDRQILHSTAVFAKLLQNIENQSENVFIGIREEDGEPMFFDPFSNPHTLVAGATGSGKSVLVQNMLLHIALTRTPTQSQIYLIDGKSGVDYLPLRNLPHIKAGSGGIIDSKGGSIEVLAGLVDEMERRYQLFKEAEAKNINHYREKSGIYLPTLWVIHDEFAEWMEDKDYAAAVETNVNRLSIKSRAAGIFMMFCAQRPDNTVMPMQLRSQLSNRLVLQVSDPGTAEIAVGEKNSRAERLLKHGHMLAKVESAKVYVQVPYIDADKELEPLVSLLKELYPAPSKSMIICSQEIA
jgi:S-DNA-T family DNA segregation ATPase FtsK/SpoIIIE